MIVTLAGHVDHGKTSLVRALTGTDTDQLAEEQRRGLTIDLGFAYMDAGGAPLGFVDVPGHHRFIHNMVAGVATLQYALLVIAADDGPMPQSKEHLQILELIGVKNGVVALSKSDRVSPDRLAQAREDVRTLLTDSFLDGCEIITTSTTSGTGIDELRRHLDAANAEHHLEVPDKNFRIAIDRAFSIKGSGVVATGTVHTGTIHIDEALGLFPSGKTVRVRSIHTQSQPAVTATLGDRCALNLTGIAREEIQRGTWLTAGETAGHRQLVVSLKVLDDFPRKIRHWMPVHVYHATTHTLAHIAVLETPSIQAGGQALVDLLCDEPLLAKRGDRVVIRDQSLDRTIGGGLVIDNGIVSTKRRNPTRLARLTIDHELSPEANFSGLLALGEVSISAFNDNWDLPVNRVDALVDDSGCIVVGDYGIAEPTWQNWRSALVKEVSDKHAHDSTRQGIKSNELAEKLTKPFRDALLAELVSEGALTLKAGHYLPRGQAVNLSQTERTLLDKVGVQLDQKQPPSLGDLAKKLALPQKQLERDLRVLAGKGELVQISANRFYLPVQLTPLAELAQKLDDPGPFTVREFRDAAGVGRNVAIEVLEYFDSRGFTRRAENTRRVVGELSRLLPTC
ncbi:MAG: selenocysteine-specific translation elongation factor [Gammaproteobacteria bacterium]|nr:selenocysteine-specific translation elongation factor [Gammaproteobacteria bacterium]